MAEFFSSSPEFFLGFFQEGFRILGFLSGGGGGGARARVSVWSFGLRVQVLGSGF